MNDTLLKHSLALAYRIIAHLNMDDHTYTHISARPDDADYFYMKPFELPFCEVTAENLIQIPLGGIKNATKDGDYNITGYIIHGTIYNARPDINAVIHLHTHEIVAVSSITAGLMPINQWAMHFYGHVSYSDYDSLVTHHESSDKIASDLGQNKVMLLRNHGSITCGLDIQEAMFYTYHLHQACKAQIQTLSMGQDVIIPPTEVLHQTVIDLLSFEEKLGHRDWNAWIRIVKH
jgi:ribulose-5-phosphate 4-epimerase/fuculose-1-phosphate aldolase